MYNSQYYTCEQIDQRLLQGYLDDYNSQNNTSLTKAQFLTKLYDALENYEDESEVLDLIEDYLGSGFLYAGLATPTGIPNLPQNHQAQLFFIAINPGTYTNYGNINITKVGLHLILWDTDTWSYDTVLEVDQQTGQSTTKTMSQKAITDILSLVSDSNIKANIGYYECDTAGATVAKVISVANYALFIGGAIKIKMANANTANNATLNINSTGAKALYYDGARASSSNTWEAGEVLDVYYDGTNFQANNSAGGGKFSTGEKVRETGIDNTPFPSSTKLVTSGGVDRYSKKRSTLLSFIGNGTTYVYSPTLSEVFLPGHTYQFAIVNFDAWECPDTLSNANEVFKIRAYTDSGAQDNPVNVSDIVTYRHLINDLVCKEFLYTFPATINNSAVNNWFVRMEGRAIADFELIVEAIDITDTYEGRDDVPLNIEDSDYVVFEADGKLIGSDVNSNHDQIASGSYNVYIHFKKVKKGEAVKVDVNSGGAVFFCSSMPRRGLPITGYDYTSSTAGLKAKEYLVESDSYICVSRPTTCKFLIKNNGVAYRVKKLETQETTGDNGINDSCALLDKNMLIGQNRDYYFDDTWTDETSYTDTSYLDRKIAEVPEGKHFIFCTDSHIDYYNAVGLAQDAVPVIKFVRDRLGIKNVAFGGDAIGNRSTKYSAAKVLSVYAKGMFEAFGSDFLWVMGNHDTNPFGTIAETLISDEEAYKRTTKFMKDYGKAVFPTKLIDIIDMSNDLVDDNGDAVTQSEKDEYKAWAMQNYYYDDNNQKIRYIVIETGDGGNTMRDMFGVVGDAQNSLLTVSYFIVDAMKNIPEGYDLVVLGHWIVASGVFWRRVFYKLLAAYKNSQAVNINFSSNSSSDHPGVNLIVTKTFDNPASISSIAIDMTTHKGSGRVFCLSGHNHYDRAVTRTYVADADPATVTPFELTTDTEPQELEYSANSILHIECDRCCAMGRGAGGTIGGADYLEGAYSFPNDLSRTPVESRTGTEIERLGTIKEVMFDVVTITPDNRVVLTRFGAEGEDNGSPYVRNYVLPMEQS